MKITNNDLNEVCASMGDTKTKNDKKTKNLNEPKKLNVKNNKKPKNTMNTAIKFFNQIKKPASLMKKSIKKLSKFYTEALKTGDQKYIDRVKKLFNRIGIIYDDANIITFAINAKVKIPKIKPLKNKNNDSTITESINTPKKRGRPKKVVPIENVEPDIKTTIVQPSETVYPAENEIIEADQVDTSVEEIPIGDTLTDERPKAFNNDEVSEDELFGNEDDESYNEDENEDEYDEIDHDPNEDFFESRAEAFSRMNDDGEYED